MQKIGNVATNGFDFNDLMYCYNMFNKISNNTIQMEMYHLNTLIPAELLSTLPKIENAYILIIRNGLNVLLSQINKTVDDLYNEQNNLNPDTKVYSYGSVKNKNADINLCFADIGQVANFEEGKGTIINFIDVPLTKYIRDWLPILLGEKAKNLQGEGNYYYDITKTGISHHGDAERKESCSLSVGCISTISVYLVS